MLALQSIPMHILRCTPEFLQSIHLLTVAGCKEGRRVSRTLRVQYTVDWELASEFSLSSQTEWTAKAVNLQKNIPPLATGVLTGYLRSDMSKELENDWFVELLVAA